MSKKFGEKLSFNKPNILLPDDFTGRIMEKLVDRPRKRWNLHSWRLATPVFAIVLMVSLASMSAALVQRGQHSVNEQKSGTDNAALAAIQSSPINLLDDEVNTAVESSALEETDLQRGGVEDNEIAQEVAATPPKQVPVVVAAIIDDIEGEARLLDSVEFDADITFDDALLSEATILN